MIIEFWILITVVVISLIVTSDGFRKKYPRWDEWLWKEPWKNWFRKEDRND